MEEQEIRKDIEKIVEKINNENLKIATQLIVKRNHKKIEDVMETLENIIKIYEMDKEINQESSKFYEVGEKLKDIGKKLGIKDLYFIAADFYLLAAKFCEYSLLKSIYYHCAIDTLKEIGLDVNKKYFFSNEEIDDLRVEIMKDFFDGI